MTEIDRISDNIESPTITDEQLTADGQSLEKVQGELIDLAERREQLPKSLREKIRYSYDVAKERVVKMGHKLAEEAKDISHLFIDRTFASKFALMGKLTHLFITATTVLHIAEQLPRGQVEGYYQLLDLLS